MNEEKELTFEAAIARLEEITKLLERGDIELEKSLAFFEEGTSLVKRCRALLDSAEQKVKVLVTTNEGKKALEDFDAGDEQN